MKKVLLCCILTLCILAGILPAHAQNLSINIAQANPLERVRSVCWVGDSLYMLGSYGIYQWDASASDCKLVVDLQESSSYLLMEQKPEGKLAAEAWSKAVQWLFSDGRVLFAMQPYSGDIFEVSGDVLNLKATLPADMLFANMGSMPMFRGIDDLAYAGDKLYLLLGTDDFEQPDKTTLLSFDMASQEAKVCAPEGVRYLLPVGDGSLHLSIQSEGASGLDIHAYTPDTDTVNEAVMSVEENLQGLPLWFKGEDSVIYISNGAVTKLQAGGEPLVKAYLPLGSFGALSARPVCSPSGVYAAANGSYVYLRDIAGNDKPNMTILHYAGDISPAILADFGAMHPDIALVSAGEGLDIQQIIQTEGAGIDLFIVQAPGIYATMLDKGYAAPLNDSAALVEMAKQLYPTLQEAIFREGNLLAFPVSLQPQSWSVNETKQEEFGFSEPPLTYADLFDGMITWDDELSEEYPDYKYFDMQENAYGFITALIREYVLQNETQDAPLSFNSPEFRDALGLILQNRQLIERNAENYGMPVIFSYSMGFGVSSNDGERVVMLAPPALNGNREQTLAASAEMVLVNAGSEQKAEALLFVEYFAANLPTRAAYMLNPSLNEPVRSATYTDRKAQMEAEIGRLKVQLEAADESNAAELQDTIAQRENSLAMLEKNQWTIAQESIDSYRSIAKALKLPYWSAFLSDGEASGMAAVAPIIQQFCDQGMQESAVDRFIGELDRVAQMIFSEQE